MSPGEILSKRVRPLAPPRSGREGPDLLADDKVIRFHSSDSVGSSPAALVASYAARQQCREGAAAVGALPRAASGLGQNPTRAILQAARWLERDKRDPGPWVPYLQILVASYKTELLFFLPKSGPRVLNGILCVVRSRWNKHSNS